MTITPRDRLVCFFYLLTRGTPDSPGLPWGSVKPVVREAARLVENTYTSEAGEALAIELADEVLGERLPSAPADTEAPGLLGRFEVVNEDHPTSHHALRGWTEHGGQGVCFDANEWDAGTVVEVRRLPSRAAPTCKTCGGLGFGTVYEPADNGFRTPEDVPCHDCEGRAAPTGVTPDLEGDALIAAMQAELHEWPPSTKALWAAVKHVKHVKAKAAVAQGRAAPREPSDHHDLPRFELGSVDDYVNRIVCWFKPTATRDPEDYTQVKQLLGQAIAASHPPGGAEPSYADVIAELEECELSTALDMLHDVFGYPEASEGTAPPPQPPEKRLVLGDEDGAPTLAVYASELWRVSIDGPDPSTITITRTAATPQPTPEVPPWARPRCEHCDCTLAKGYHEPQCPTREPKGSGVPDAPGCWRAYVGEHWTVPVEVVRGGDGGLFAEVRGVAGDTRRIAVPIQRLKWGGKVERGDAGLRGRVEAVMSTFERKADAFEGHAGLQDKRHAYVDCALMLRAALGES